MGSVTELACGAERDVVPETLHDNKMRSRLRKIPDHQTNYMVQI